MTKDELLAEQADLQRKLEVRTRVGTGYAQNIIAIQARLDAIEEELNTDNG